MGKIHDFLNRVWLAELVQGNGEIRICGNGEPPYIVVPDLKFETSLEWEQHWRSTKPHEISDEEMLRAAQNIISRRMR